MSKNKRILLLSGNPLCLNPRVVKEADALTEAGYKVEVLGRGDLPNLFEQDLILLKKRKWKYKPIFAESTCIGKLIGKVQRYLGNQLFRLFRVENHWQFGAMPTALLKDGRKRSAFLYIAHSEAGMWAAEQLRKEGKRVGVDMEDWFSEDLLPEARKKRPIRLLKELERSLLCHGAYSSCTSEAMADALVKEYGCRRPVVIRNVFPVKDRKGMDGKWKDRPWMVKWLKRNDPKSERPKEAPVSIHWFSQTIGPGRGLETLFQALHGVEGNWELHLRGNVKGYEKWLEQVSSAQIRERLILHAMVANSELPSRIAEHDIGYAGELHDPISRNLTITNKLFQYLQAGLAVVASDTAGQLEAAFEAKGAVRIFRAVKKMDLAQNLGEPLRNRSALKETRRSAWEAGAKLSWENEKEKFSLTYI